MTFDKTNVYCNRLTARSDRHVHVVFCRGGGNLKFLHCGLGLRFSSDADIVRLTNARIIIIIIIIYFLASFTRDD